MSPSLSKSPGMMFALLFESVPGIAME